MIEVTNIFYSAFNQSVMITGFVLIMMLVIEYVNVQTKNQWNQSLRKKPILQILLSAILGITPGCLGAYTVVSLYTHRLINFAALVTVMIATSGDEAFIMFSMMPDTAIKLNIIIFFIAMTTGILLVSFSKNKKPLLPVQEMHFKIHNDTKCICFDSSKIIPQIKDMSFNRFLLLTGTFVFILFLITGKIGPAEWNWKRWLFFSGSLFFLFVTLTSPSHFLEKHIWEHIIKKHLPRIFLWTFGTILFLHLFEYYFDLETWIKNNTIWILLIAVLIGIIPESGPHLIFITMFASGLMPFSVLLASSIVQDGHGMLPLLAESKKDFVKVKLINMAVGLLVGVIGFAFGT
ncbi:MAG TPA: hypothetical protein EYP69_01640 [Bacteroidales bacterium]|nr:hypothetical protein [Bacteroidales bacterium]